MVLNYPGNCLLKRVTEDCAFSKKNVRKKNGLAQILEDKKQGLKTTKCGNSDWLCISS